MAFVSWIACRPLLYLKSGCSIDDFARFVKRLDSPFFVTKNGSLRGTSTAHSRGTEGRQKPAFRPHSTHAGAFQNHAVFCLVQACSRRPSPPLHGLGEGDPIRGGAEHAPGGPGGPTAR